MQYLFFFAYRKKWEKMRGKEREREKQKLVSLTRQCDDDVWSNDLWRKGGDWSGERGEKISRLLYCGISFFSVLQTSRQRFCREKTIAQVTEKEKKKRREKRREKKMLMKESHGWTRVDSFWPDNLGNVSFFFRSL